MPVFLWLALFLGYFVGVAGALYLLPAAVVGPFVGRIVIASVIVILGAATFVVLQRRRSGRPAFAGGMSVREFIWRRRGEPGRGRSTSAGAGGRAERIDDIAGDPERLQVLGARQNDPLARGRDGSLGPRELRQLLYDGRVEILARAVIALPGRERAYLQITPRLLDHREQVVPPALYQRTAARCGLDAVFDRVQVIRALQAADAVPRGEEPPAIACTIDARSLTSPVLLDGLEDVFRDGVGRGGRLILELERIPREPAVRQAVRRVMRHGVRLALKRLSAAPLDLERMTDMGFQFVRLAAPRFGMLPGGAAGAPPALGALLAAAGEAGLTVVVDEAESELAPILGEGRIETPLPPPDEARDDAA